MPLIREDVFIFPKGKLSEDDKILLKSVRDYLKKNLIDRRLELSEDYERLLNPAYRGLMIDLGIQKMCFPEKLGGYGHSEKRAAYTITAIMEEVGFADAGIGWAMASALSLHAACSCSEFATRDSLDLLASAFCDTEKAKIVALILPEFADAKEEEKTISYRGKYCQCILNEESERIGLSGYNIRPKGFALDCDMFAVLNISQEREPLLIAVDSGSEGIKAEKSIKETGLAFSRNAILNFKNVQSGPDAILLSGQDAISCRNAWFKLCVSAICVGAMASSYEVLREWAENRNIKGEGNLLKDNPLAASLMSKTACALAVSRTLLYSLGSSIAEPEVYDDAGWEALEVFSEVVCGTIMSGADENIHHMMELMASAGYASEGQIERCWRDVKTIQCHMGSKDIEQTVLAGWFFNSKAL